MEDNKKSIKLLVEQTAMAHEVLEGTIEGTGEEHTHFQDVGTALPVGAAYGHAIFSEDSFVSMQAKSQPLFMTEFKDKTGFSEPMPAPSDDWSKQHADWSKRIKVDLKRAREYAKAVYAKTEKYLNTLTDDNLTDDVDFTSWGIGMKPMSWAISMVIIGHINNLAGEISAIKGVQGLKGYPF